MPLLTIRPEVTPYTEEQLAKFRDHRFRDSDEDVDCILSPSQRTALLASEVVTEDERETLRKDEAAVIKKPALDVLPPTPAEMEYARSRGLIGWTPASGPSLKRAVVPQRTARTLATPRPRRSRPQRRTTAAAASSRDGPLPPADDDPPLAKFQRALARLLGGAR